MIFSQYFGNYLLEQGLITPPQLRDALERQNSVHVKLGVLAMDALYMTAEQVDDVVAIQKKQDKRFGEIALAKGYLTGIQLDILLNRQTPEHVLLAQVLVDMGIFSFVELEKAMEQYRLAQGMDIAEFDAVKSNDVETLLLAALGLRDEKYRWYSDYILVFVKNLVRFIDSNVLVGKARTIGRYEYKWLASQGIEGELTLFSALTANEDVLIAFAAAFADMHIAEMGEIAWASLGEFLNCQNGIFASNLHDKGITVDLMPPEVTSDGVITSKGTLFCIPITLGLGEIDLIIADFLRVL
jgi:hypothetical protein